MVTNAEYQKANNAVNSQYTADSLQNYQNAYNDYMSQGMSSKEAVNKAKGLLVQVGNNQTSTPVNNTPSYENQGSGNYVYNEKTGYYENQTPTTPTPETPTKQETIKQEEKVVNTDSNIQQQGELKPLSKEYYSQTSDEAQNTIRNNLNGYRQTNPELFSDYETFKKNFSYDARDDVQKQTLDNWYMGYTKGLELSNIPTNELYTQYKDGQVSISDLENLRVSNPTKYAELQATINKGNIISAYDDTPKSSTNSIQDMAYQMMVQTFNNFMNGDSSSGASNIFREYEGKMNDPEMTGLSDKCTEVKEEMDNIQSDIDSMKKQVEAEYEGTGASRSKINAIISDRTYDLQLQLRTLNSEYNKYATQYNNRMQQYQNEFTMQIQEYQLNQQERQYQMKELGFALDLMNFETNDQKQEREWNYRVRQQEYQNGNINSKDYQTRYKAALTSVQNLLSQYEGIPMVRSAEQMAQDVLKAIDGGSDLGTELTKINQQIQQKPEYKYKYNEAYGKGNEISYKTFKLNDKEYIVYNNELMSADEFNSKYGGKAAGATGEAKPYDIVDAKAFDTNTMVSKGYPTLGEFLVDPRNALKKNGGWCGAFVNKYLKSIGVTNENYYDDNLSTKLNSVNTKVPQVGSIAVFDYGHITSETGQNHGHVAIVTNVNKDGTFDVIESNFNGDKIIGERKNINPQSSTCKGFFDPSQPPAGSQSSSEGQGFVTGRIGLYDKYINSGVKPTDAMLKGWGNGDIAKGLDMFESEVEAYKASQGYNETYSPEAVSEITALRKEFNGLDTVKTYRSMQDYYDKMMRANNSTAAGDMAMVFNFMKMLDPGSVVREGEFANAAATAGLGTRLVGYFKKVDSGEILTKSQRDDFIKIAQEYLQGAAERYNKDLKQYQSYITKGGDANKIGELADINSLSSLSSNNQNIPSNERYMSVMSDYSRSVLNNNYVNIDGYEFDLSGF